MKASEWGEVYGGPIAYVLPDGRQVVMRRKRQAVRFFNVRTGRQIGPEQRNVGPAVCYALYKGWFEPPGSNIPLWMQKAGHREAQRNTKINRRGT